MEIDDDPPLPPLPSPVALLRGVVRAGLVLIVVGLALIDYWLNVRSNPHTKRKSQAEWLHRGCSRVAKLLSIRIETVGPIPRDGLIVSNHLSYADIILLAATSPFAFVAKAEIADWPIFGLCAKLAGTVFIDRTRRSEVAPVADEMSSVLQAGVPLVLFAEGTSTGGDRVLPFKPALFAPAVALGIPITPCAIGYALSEGSVTDEICYWGDDSFAPHLFHLLGKLGITVRIQFGPRKAPSIDRKETSRSLHAHVLQLYQASGMMQPECSTPAITSEGN